MRFNISRIKLDMACPTKQALTYSMPIFKGHPPGMVRRSDVKPAAVFGSAYHKALELITKGMNRNDALIVAKDMLQEAAAKARSNNVIWAAERIEYGTGGAPYACKRCKGVGKYECKVCRGTGMLKRGGPHGVCAGTGSFVCGLCEGMGVFTASGTEGVEYLVKAVDKYLEANILNPTRFDEILKVEETLELVLENGYTLVGRVDVAGRQNGRLWHLNHKTLYKGGKVENEIKKYEMDYHEIAYWLMLEEKYKEVAAGSWIDFLVKQPNPEAHRLAIARADKMVETGLYLFNQATSRLAAFVPEDIDKLERRTINCVQYGYVCPFMDYCQGSMGLDEEELDMAGFEAREEDYVDNEGGGE